MNAKTPTLTTYKNLVLINTKDGREITVYNMNVINLDRMKVELIFLEGIEIKKFDLLRFAAKALFGNMQNFRELQKKYIAFDGSASNSSQAILFNAYEIVLMLAEKHGFTDCI